MKTILALVLNDLKRDWKSPWAMFLFTALPLAMSVLIAAVFTGPKGSEPAPTIHIAVLDEDKDMLSRMLRSMPAQGDAAQRLQLHFVDSRTEGLRMLERGKASGLVILPKDLTTGLLTGQTNALDLYENPAQQILPKIVREGTSLLALGLSSAAELLGEPLTEMRSLFNKDEFPATPAVTSVADSAVSKLQHVRTYAFPPLVKFETVPAANFTPSLSKSEIVPEGK